MSVAEVKAVLVDWFGKRNPEKQIDVGADYYKSGLIDSFGIIELISFAESELGVRFSDEDFKNPQFRNISGLSEIVAARCAPSVKD